MRERVERPRRPAGARRLGDDVPLRVRPDPAARGPAARLPLELHDLRPADQMRLVKRCLEELERDPKRFTPRGIHSQISNAKNTPRRPGRSTRERVASFYDQTVAEVYDLYQKRLFASNAVDFDDMLFLTVDVLERFPEARAEVAGGVPLRPRRRVPGHEPRAVPAAPAPRREAPQRLRGRRSRTSRSTGSAAPTSATSSSSSTTSPASYTIALEQNYRSTQHILDAANGVIQHNRERKEKNLWSELGDGDPVRVDRGRGRARRGAVRRRRDRALVEEGFSGSEVAVFYRTNAQSRVLEDVLVRQGIAYQVIGGPRFYERAEVKDLVAYLQVLDNPYDAVSLLRIANRPRRGIGDTSLARLADVGRPARRSRSGRRPRRPRWPASAPRRRRRSRRSAARSSRSCPPRRSSRCRSCIEEVLARSGYLESLEAERTIEAQGRMENLAGARLRRARVARAGRRRHDALGLPAGDLALLRPGRDPRRRLARHAHDPPQREGPRVPRRLPDRDGGGDLPALALDRGAGSRGGAAALLRRHDAREGAADADARVVADALRRARPQPAVALPRRGAGRTRRARAAAAGVVVRLRRAAPEPDRAARGRARSLAPATPSATRRSARASSCGSRPGGLVTVRFADDGSERKLMLDYAPLEKM